MKKTYIAHTAQGIFKLVEKDGVCAAIARGDQWDKFLTDLVYTKYLNKNSVVVSGGANFGSQTVPLSRICKKVYAFEPQLFVYSCLKETLELNKIANVTLYSYALFSHDCRMRITEGFQNSIQYGDRQVSSLFLQEDPNGDIEAKSIDSFNFPELHLIKLDCQGSEPFILKGATETINRLRPLIVYEVEDHPVYGEHNTKTFENFFVPINYKIVQLMIGPSCRDFLAIPCEKF